MEFLSSCNAVIFFLGREETSIATINPAGDKTWFIVAVVVCERSGSAFLNIFKMIHVILTNA